MKRTASNAGSPPPSSAPPKPKKPRAPRTKKPKKGTTAGGDAGSPPPYGSAAASPVGASSPPAYADSPAAFGGGGKRERSASVADGIGKGKERAGTAGADVEAQGVGLAVTGPDGEEQDAEDEVFEFSDDEVSTRSDLLSLLVGSKLAENTELMPARTLQFGSNQREVAKQKEDLRVLLEHFDEQQMDRYEAYRRSGLTKSSVRKVRGREADRSRRRR